uniref:Putative replicase n=1 Tax=Ansystermes virus TaxID=2796576 RepID=A0A7T7GUX6_9VIRU|nr:putative replicase [Ansystermes virus]
MQALKASIKDNLCKQCRAAGLPKVETLLIVNLIEKWYQSCGVEWTVSRLKDLHDWYIRQLAGDPNIPAWISHHANSPKGPFRCVFKMKNTQKALVIMSLHTVFTHDKVSPNQLNKLIEGLKSKEVPNVAERKNRPHLNVRSIPKLSYESPTLRSMTGISIPVGAQVISLLKPNKQLVANAYARSWFDLPSETATFIRNAGLTMHAPEVLLDKHFKGPIGTMSAVQQPSLKARWISNPNRITQHFLGPLDDAWKKWLSWFPSDCTRDQNRGVIWASTKLKNGVKLASADLTSATDKLNLRPCLDMVHMFKCGNTFGEIIEDALNRREVDTDEWKHVDAYIYAVKHFLDVSRGTWIMDGNEYGWDVGWPLGTRPSFSLLGLVNNITAYNAAVKCKLNWRDSFCVLGDDIVMDEKMLSDYTYRITALGGVVNPSKSIVSDKIAEFAGRVIDAKGSYLKRVVVKGVSDNSFLELMQNMGDQAKWLLKKRQRRVWDRLKYIPGEVVSGPHSRESHGEPIRLRYEWYLTHIAKPKVDPDPILLEPQQMALQLVLALEEAFGPLDRNSTKEWYIPRDIWERVHPSKTAYPESRVSSDPRLVNGLSALEVGERIINNDTFLPYQDFKKANQPTGDSSPSVPIPSAVPPKTKGGGRH